MRAAIYARVSTRDKQEVENQLAQLREFLARSGWTAAGEYIDHESGARADRPEFRRLFADASRLQFDVVLFWSLDRFSREGVLETLQHLQRLTAAGVGYRSFTEQYLDSCGVFRDAVLSILATIAKQERIRIVERTRAGLERARRAGQSLGRPKRVVDAVRIREMHTAGASLAAIAAAAGVSKETVRRRLSQQQPGERDRAGDRSANQQGIGLNG